MFVEDFATYLADFGQVVTLNGATVTVIFDNAYGEAFDMATRVPRAGLPTASATAANAAVGCAFVLGSGGTYRVTSLQPDGTGWTTLELELQ
jgi:hypothetical protein